MSLEKEARRISLGQELTSAFSQLESGVATVKAAKARIEAIKNKMINEPSLYPASDLTDINKTLTDVDTEVGTI